LHGDGMMPWISQAPTDSSRPRRRSSESARQASKEDKRPTQTGIKKSRARYTPGNPPPFGVVQHPESSGELRAGEYVISTLESEVTLALVVPCHVVVRSALFNFSKAQVKWEPIPRGTTVTYFKDMCVSGTSEDSAQHYRVVVKVLLPLPGQYQVRFWWGHFPTETKLCNNLNSVPASFEHPLKIGVTLEQGARVLMPSTYHHTLTHFGYPLKHPLAEHYGLTLMGPLRYRLQTGWVRFTVHVNQGRLAASARPKTLVVANYGLGFRGSPEEQLEEQDDDAGPARGVRKGSKRPSAADDEDSGEEGSVTGSQMTPGEVLEQTQRVASELLMHQSRRGREDPLCLALVIGQWRRVEVLHWRPLEPQQLPKAEDDSGPGSGQRSPDGHAPQDAGQGPPKAACKELHEAVVRISKADIGQTAQLMVFQFGTEERHRAQGGLPHFLKGKEENVPLGLVEAPQRWCLAEFMAEGSHPLPYDEAEMAKPLPPAKDSLETVVSSSKKES